MTGTFTGGATHGIAVGPGDRSAPRVAVILGGAAWIPVPAHLAALRPGQPSGTVLSLIPPRSHVETSFSAEHQRAFWALA